jgi:hypothetical protein
MRENHNDADASSRRSLACNSFTMKFLPLGMCFDCRAGARRVMRHGLRRGNQSLIRRAPVLYLVLASSVVDKSTSMSNTFARNFSEKELDTKRDNF